MHTKILGVFLFLLAAWGIWYVTSLSITPNANGPYLDVDGKNVATSDVYFELDTIPVAYSDGDSGELDVSIPYLLIEGEKVYPFGDDRNIIPRGYTMSYDKRYLYFGKGIGPKDPAVQNFIFDVEERQLHLVVQENDESLGFGNYEDALVWWEQDGLMYIENNVERYVSVSPETPWIVEVWE